MEWVGGLLNGGVQQSPATSSSNGKSSKTEARPSIDGATQTMAAMLLDPSPTSTKVGVRCNTTFATCTSSYSWGTKRGERDD